MAKYKINIVLCAGEFPRPRDWSAVGGAGRQEAFWILEQRALGGWCPRQEPGLRMGDYRQDSGVLSHHKEVDSPHPST